MLDLLDGLEFLTAMRIRVVILLAEDGVLSADQADAIVVVLEQFDGALRLRHLANVVENNAGFMTLVNRLAAIPSSSS